MPNYDQCIILLFDGARFDVFDNLLKSGELVNIKKYILSKGTFLKAYSSLSTTTGPAHIPFIYGSFPGTANVPGIRWFDKSALKRKANPNSIMRSYVGPKCFAIGSDVSPGHIPLYDFFTSPVSAFSVLDKNRNVKIKNNRIQTMAHCLFCHYTHRWELTDQTAARSLKKQVGKNRDFIFFVFPAIDKLSHLYHPFHEKVVKLYLQLDERIGEIFHDLPETEAGKKLIFIVSDHGLSQTHTHISLVNLSQDEGFRPVYYPKILKRKYDMAIMESGNAMAFIYFMNPIDNRPLFYEEIASIDKNRKFIDRLLTTDGIDFISYRIDDSSIGVMGKDGEANLAFKDDGQVQVNVIGDNPLGFESDLSQMALDESLGFTQDTDYPDSIVQLNQLFRSKRTGDLVVFAKDGFDLRDKHEWPEHKSSHGSLQKSHMEVPVCTNIRLSSSSCRTVDIVPTILQRLGYDIPSNLDGKVIL